MRYSKLGLAPGERVAVLLDNSVHSVASVFGVEKAALTYVALNARHTLAEQLDVLADADRRIEQAARVADRVRADPAPLSIVVGDLNTTGEVAVEVLREFRAVGLFDAGGTVSNPSTSPYQRIDYVLLPTTARVLISSPPAGGEEWARLSDHLPVTVTFDT